MEILTYVGIALLGAFLIYMFIVYNSLVNANNHVEETFVRMDMKGDIIYPTGSTKIIME